MGIVLLPVAFLLLLCAAVAARGLLLDLWDQGAIQAFLLLVVLPGAVWIIQSLVRESWAARKKRLAGLR